MLYDHLSSINSQDSEILKTLNQNFEPKVWLKFVFLTKNASPDSPLESLQPVKNSWLIKLDNWPNC